MEAASQAAEAMAIRASGKAAVMEVTAAVTEVATAAPEATAVMEATDSLFMEARGCCLRALPPQRH
jgi:hypothetical protein